MNVKSSPANLRGARWNSRSAARIRRSWIFNDFESCPTFNNRELTRGGPRRRGLVSVAQHFRSLISKIRLDDTCSKRGIFLKRFFSLLLSRRSRQFRLIRNSIPLETKLQCSTNSILKEDAATLWSWNYNGITKPACADSVHFVRGDIIATFEGSLLNLFYIFYFVSCWNSRISPFRINLTSYFPDATKM